VKAICEAQKVSALHGNEETKKKYVGCKTQGDRKSLYNQISGPVRFISSRTLPGMSYNFFL
jgi:hypothetical protein